jgi:L-threonylcarbamoyladenylate synthase
MLHVIGDARDTFVVQRLRQLKKRPVSKGFTVLVDSDARLNKYVHEVPPIAWDIIDTAVDPLILVLPQGRQVAPEALAADGSIAIRMVQSPEERTLVQTVNGPVACTALLSQNGTPAETLAQADPAALSEVDYVLTLPPAKKGRSLRKIPIIALGMDGEVKIVRE